MEKKILLLLLLPIMNFNLFANENLYVLYGLKLGQDMSVVSNLYGKPFKSHTFDDGFRYDAYKIKDHILIVEANNTRPDLIWGIQIQGKNNPEFYGLNGLNLSDSATRIIEIFGEPDEKRQSIDEETKEEIDGIQYYSYDKKKNFSIETTNKFVTSIKITFKGFNKSSDSINFKNFIDVLKTKNYYNISSLISPELKFKKDKEYTIEKSIINSLINKTEISNYIFDNKIGLISFTEKNIGEEIPIRNKEGNVIAYYFKINKDKKNVHLFFLRSFEGWVLKEINLND